MIIHCSNCGKMCGVIKDGYLYKEAYVFCKDCKPQHPLHTFWYQLKGIFARMSKERLNQHKPLALA